MIKIENIFNFEVSIKAIEKVVNSQMADFDLATKLRLESYDSCGFQLAAKFDDLSELYKTKFKQIKNLSVDWENFSLFECYFEKVEGNSGFRFYDSRYYKFYIEKDTIREWIKGEGSLSINADKMFYSKNDNRKTYFKKIHDDVLESIDTIKLVSEISLDENILKKVQKIHDLKQQYEDLSVKVENEVMKLIELKKDF